MQQDVKFIRKNGRVIPIKQGSGQVKQPKAKQPKKQSVKPKTQASKPKDLTATLNKIDNFAQGALAVGVFGATAAYVISRGRAKKARSALKVIKGRLPKPRGSGSSSKLARKLNRRLKKEGSKGFLTTGADLARHQARTKQSKLGSPQLAKKMSKSARFYEGFARGSHKVAETLRKFLKH